MKVILCGDWGFTWGFAWGFASVGLCFLVLESIMVSNTLVLCLRSWFSSLVSLYFLFRSFISCVSWFLFRVFLCFFPASPDELAL